MTETPNLHLISFYSDNKYKKAALRLREQALESSLFASAKIWNPKLIKKVAPVRFGNLQAIIELNAQNRMGYGLWYWKPVIIEESLKVLPKGSILVYLDAGCYLNLNNPTSRARLEAYIQFAKNHGSLAMQLIDGEFGINDLSEEAWTSQNVLEDLEILEEHRHTNQVQAGIQILEVNSHNLAFTTSWRVLCEIGKFQYLMGLEGSKNRNFQSHRFDQSIFSCLYKKEARFLIQDETYFEPDWETQGEDFPIWAMRNRDGIDPFEFRTKDLYARVRRKIRFMAKRCL